MGCIDKNWDAYVIGSVVSDEVDDMGFTTLVTSLEEELSLDFNTADLRNFLALITCWRIRDVDTSNRIALYFSNLSKNYGHPVLNPNDGIKKLRLNSTKQIKVDDLLAKRILWKERALKIGYKDCREDSHEG